jgi:hypothetical protein
MRKIASFFGGILIFLLGCAVVTVLSIFVVGAFCVSYPITRLSPRDARLKAVMDLLMALATAAAVLKPKQLAEVLEEAAEEDEVAPKDT